jgi:two-component system, OmpR family, sensor histidine kinase BaeS
VRYRGLGPLGIRIAAAFVGVALAAVAVFAAAVLIADRGDVSDLAATDRNHAADALATVLRNAYQETGSWASADVGPAEALADESGAAARVLDPQGSPVLTVGPPGLFTEKGTSVVDRPISDNGSALGTVQVAMMANGLSISQSHLRSTLAGAVGLSAALAAVGALVVGVVVARGVVRPVKRLSDAARSLERGTSGARVGPRAGPGELGELGRAFDSMAASLEREDHLRRALVADVAHELRTPVAILQAETEALVDGVTAATPETLVSLHEEAVRLGRMVEDLQTLASAEAAGLQLQRRPLDLSRVVAEASDSLASRFRTAGVTLHQTLPPTFVLGDPHRLHQVIANLLANAVKFTPTGGTVSVCVAPQGSDAVLEVLDTGPGIPEHEQPLVWQRFYQGETGRMAMGNGIGLAVVKELVDAHGGTVGVGDAPGGGARFFVRIPLATTVVPEA